MKIIDKYYEGGINMKATGIVRRIDDLGRVVIPKEIRRTLRIREGDPLEIFTDKDGAVILKKYSPIGELGLFSKQFAETISQTIGNVVCITDKDQVITVSGGHKKELFEKAISKDLEDLINERGQVWAKKGDKEFINLIEDNELEFESQIIMPIISEGDAIGAVIMLAEEEVGELEHKVILCAATFLGKQMEQ